MVANANDDDRSVDESGESDAPKKKGKRKRLKVGGEWRKALADPESEEMYFELEKRFRAHRKEEFKEDGGERLGWYKAAADYWNEGRKERRKNANVAKERSADSEMVEMTIINENGKRQVIKARQKTTDDILNAEIWMV